MLESAPLVPSSTAFQWPHPRPPHRAGDPQSRYIPRVEGQTGLYFNGLHEAKAQAQAYDLDARRQLQALSLELTGLSAQGVAALER